MGSSPPSSPANGDLWYNTTDQTLYVWNGSSWVIAGGKGVTVSDSPPPNAVQGDLWFASDIAQLFVFYVDQTSSQWVVANSSGTGSLVGENLWTETTQTMTANGIVNLIAQWAIPAGDWDLTAAFAFKNVFGTEVWSGTAQAAIQFLWPGVETDVCMSVTVPAHQEAGAAIMTCGGYIGPMLCKASADTFVQLVANINITPFPTNGVTAIGKIRLRRMR